MLFRALIVKLGLPVPNHEEVDRNEGIYSFFSIAKLYIVSWRV